MTNHILSEPILKRRRIMIISGDESVIDEIQKNNNISLCKSIILDTIDEDIQISHLKTQTTNQKKQKNVSLICAICGSTANGYNFDVISCESCKSFFRRNALKDPPLKCLHQGTCDVSLNSRRHCSACRLTKCFNSGMRRERLLIAEQKSEIRRHRQEHQSLNINTTEQQVQLSPSLSFNDLSSILDQELSLFSECLQNHSVQSKKALLSPEDLQRLESIPFFYQKRIELARDGLPSNKIMCTTTFLQQLNSHSIPLIRLLTFFKQIPEFNELNVDDRVTLIKFNLLPLLCINCTLSYKSETDQIIETDSDIPWDPSVIQTVYGMDGYNELKKIFDQFLHIAKYDQKIIQLALITFMLTKGFSVAIIDEPILNDSMAVYRAQNYYIELLWKYMETVHGSDITIQIFSKLIAHFMTWQALQIKLRNIIEQNLLSTNINELLPFMKAILHIS
ncbi:unnamed protein product [Rotaria sp. Silwood2]|nr:unnamed protein product [Rotaria sp. Silwood2]CAF2696550.1 unnamed protein product [Rotaria sp. Silwood2]CAF2936522.1 unnamed protein product [Rotaria sp. Silwood2]CAF4386332.1 unnamed protein product [Rotaria sp. Silwood2]CAF4509448.1 unnamed protein product [Rotaria sp. Silwood2]